MKAFKKPFFVVAAVLVVLLPAGALAQFQPASGKTFLDFANLQVNPAPGQQSEAMVYAIIDDDVALYSIAVRNRNNISVLGAFQCNKEFSILKTSSNGFYDIRCVDEGMFDNRNEYILRFDGSTYVQDFT